MGVRLFWSKNDTSSSCNKMRRNPNYFPLVAGLMHLGAEQLVPVEHLEVLEGPGLEEHE